MKVHQAHLLMGTLFTLTVVATVAMTMDWSTGMSVGVPLGFMLWAAAPTVVPSVGGWFLRKSQRAVVCCMLGLLVSFSLMAYFYIYSFMINPDPQGGLILIFGPLYASVALVPFGIVALVFYFSGPRGDSSSPAPIS